MLFYVLVMISKCLTSLVLHYHPRNLRIRDPEPNRKPLDYVVACFAPLFHTVFSLYFILHCSPLNKDSKS